MTGSRGQDSGDGTVALWSAQMLDGSNYYVSRVAHLKLPREQDVIDAILTLARGDTPSLPTAVPVMRGPVAAPSPTPQPDMDAEAERLRAAIESGTFTPADMESLFFLP